MGSVHTKTFANMSKDIECSMFANYMTKVKLPRCPQPNMSMMKFKKK